MTGFDADLYRRLVESSPEGLVLVDAKGRTLYLFQGDQPNVSRLSVAGQAVWPPFNANVKPAATGGAVGGCLSATVCEGVGLGYEFTVVADATYPPNRWDIVGLEDRADDGIRSLCRRKQLSANVRRDESQDRRARGNEVVAHVGSLLTAVALCGCNPREPPCKPIGACPK